MAEAGGERPPALALDPADNLAIAVIAGGEAQAVLS
jgi:hypothetical protein